jgi:hypothetical protein
MNTSSPTHPKPFLVACDDLHPPNGSSPLHQHPPCCADPSKLVDLRVWVTYSPSKGFNTSDSTRFNCRIVTTQANAQALLPWWYITNINPAGTVLLVFIICTVLVQLMKMSVWIVGAVWGPIGAAFDNWRANIARDVDRCDVYKKIAKEVPQARRTPRMSSGASPRAASG